MAFQPVKTDTGAVPPWEYLPAAAGAYITGQLLNMEGGKLAAVGADSTTTPPYLCMSTVTAADGDILAVQRVGDDIIYETAASGAISGAVVGGKLQVASGGLMVKTGDGTFEITALDGTADGSIVRGRFVAAAAGAGA